MEHTHRNRHISRVTAITDSCQVNAERLRVRHVLQIYRYLTCADHRCSIHIGYSICSRRNGDVRKSGDRRRETDDDLVFVWRVLGDARLDPTRTDERQIDIERSGAAMRFAGTGADRNYGARGALRAAEDR